MCRFCHLSMHYAVQPLCKAPVKESKKYATLTDSIWGIFIPSHALLLYQQSIRLNYMLGNTQRILKIAYKNDKKFFSTFSSLRRLLALFCRTWGSILPWTEAFQQSPWIVITFWKRSCITLHVHMDASSSHKPVARLNAYCLYKFCLL